MTDLSDNVVETFIEPKVKRYMIFGGDTGPNGGWEDYKGSFGQLEKSREFARFHFKWYHIVDHTTGMRV